MGISNGFARLAMLASDTERAQEAAHELRQVQEFCPIEEAEAIAVIGGDGFMLQTLHHLLDTGTVKPVYGVNLGTVGFLRRYLGEYLGHRLRGSSHTQAYRAISLEVEAYSIAAAVSG